MKAVILDGSVGGNGAEQRIYDEVVRELTSVGCEVQPFILRDMNLAYCLGCFECWVKTPGECRHHDEGPDIARELIQSDLAVFFTPVTFGGYSSELKKGMDRMICLISPFFAKRNGEVHHKLRYDRYPSMLAIGVMSGEDEESERIFGKLLERNALNMMPPAHASGVVISGHSDEEIHEEIKLLLSAVGVGS